MGVTPLFCLIIGSRLWFSLHVNGISLLIPFLGMVRGVSYCIFWFSAVLPFLVLERINLLGYRSFSITTIIRFSNFSLIPDILYSPCLSTWTVSDVCQNIYPLDCTAVLMQYPWFNKMGFLLSPSLHEIRRLVEKAVTRERLCVDVASIGGKGIFRVFQRFLLLVSTRTALLSIGDLP